MTKKLTKPAGTARRAVRNLALLATLAVAICARAATPMISNVKAQQRYPWNGLVDIDYTITGDTTGLNLSFSVRDEQNDKTYTPATFLAPPSAAEGTHRVTWSPKGDGLSIISTNIVVTVLLTRTVVPPEHTGEHGMVQLWEGGPYWATTNIGAEKPEDYGYYFWWGDTVGYKWENEQWVASDGSSFNFSFTPESTPTYYKAVATLLDEEWVVSQNVTYVLASAHDAVHVHWGGKWRMPTNQELDDLYSKCAWILTTTNGVQGWVVKGKGTYSSSSIFLPCAGYGYGTSLRNAGSIDNNADAIGCFWSSVPSSDDYHAWDFGFNSSSPNMIGVSYRYYGRSVRPVQGFIE